MKSHKKVRNAYRTLRSIVFSAALAVVCLFACLYFTLSLPSVQKRILAIACTETSKLLGGRVEAERLDLRLFNEVVLHGVSLTSPAGDRCIEVGTLGAGIDLRRLIFDRRIEVTYAEILGLKACLSQAEKGGPLNIRFMIDALRPKDKNKPPTKFDLNIRTVVIRDGVVTFDRKWQPRLNDSTRIDFNHLAVENLSLDMSVPRIKNDDFIFRLRRLSFTTPQGLDLKRLGFVAEVSKRQINVRGLTVELPGTALTFSDMELPTGGDYRLIPEALKNGTHRVRVAAERITPRDLRALMPQLSQIVTPLSLTLEAEGNASHVELRDFDLRSLGGSLQPVSLRLSAAASGLDDPKKACIMVDGMHLDVSQAFIAAAISGIPLKARPRGFIARAGSVKLDLKGKCDLETGYVAGDLTLECGAGSLRLSDIKAAGITGKQPDISLSAVSQGFNAGRLLGISDIGTAVFDIDASVKLGGKIPDGEVNALIDRIDLRGMSMTGISLLASKTGEDASLDLEVSDPRIEASVLTEGRIAGAESRLVVDGAVNRFTPSDFALLGKYPGYGLTGSFHGDISGDNADNLAGFLQLDNISFARRGDDKSVRLNYLRVDADHMPEGGRDIAIDSDLLQGYVKGNFRVAGVVRAVQCMLSQAMPSLVPCPTDGYDESTMVDYQLTLRPDHEVLDFFNLPVRPLTDVDISGDIDGLAGISELNLDAPYLQQGKNKLVRDTKVRALIDASGRMASVGLTTSLPVKFGQLSLDIKASGHDDGLLADVSWTLPDADRMSGRISLGADFERNPLDRSMGLLLNIDPSDFVMNGARWRIGGGVVSFSGKRLEVGNLLVSHGDQFVEIGGTASQFPEDSIYGRLGGIDLGYIFDTLNINYVTFGGSASGEVFASNLFSSEPHAATRWLDVKGLTYNGALLGDARMSGRYDPVEKMVGIGADIREGGRRVGLVDGGIWVTRDSLSLDFDTNHINVAFLAPFMSAFSSGLEGRASGKAKLFGTFSDIDLTGRLHADTVRVKLDFTNTWYSGSDSVFFDPGRITVPPFRLYDRDGHSGVFSGTLTHRYFHEPEFDFRLRDARELLCYDTNPRINPDWYGTVYGSGSAYITGRPGLVSINCDMTTDARSAFTMVLNDTQAAEDYRFLTFSDRKRQAEEALRPDTVPEFLKRFQKRVALEEGEPTNVELDIRATVTPEALLTLVMDPAGGDRITARGSGAMLMEYASEGNDMKMFGKYTLDEGMYKFSLQDIILKDFSIRRGSTISFNGDPLNANLDIAATYRVNTDLTDLDKSFAEERDLNRTNVPVDAVLRVNGPMTSPDIAFDIDLPTLTEDVGRKVRSLISTSDMMSRQIIYLLALNRFYTPEYTGSSSNGAEFSSIASSTLSSQLSNVLSSLTDKLMVSPSFRSDKGDFSDMEVDLALSSRLLNNRLLINGNFGYRDRSTSSTTFVGDFDIEYLLTRDGNLRLKAYNHFNDQNYYLRSALTTQGIGIVLRHEFDDFLSFLRRRQKEDKPVKDKGKKDKKENGDSVVHTEAVMHEGNAGAVSEKKKDYKKHGQL